MNAIGSGCPAGRRGIRAWRGLLGLLLVLALLGRPVGAADTELITYPDRAGYALDREQLRALFTMRLRQWPDGRPVQVFVMAEDSPLHERFCRERLGMYPYVLHAVWDRLVFTGTGLAPTVVHTDAEMRRQVLSTPGAIGYVGTGPSGQAESEHVAAAAGPMAAGGPR